MVSTRVVAIRTLIRASPSVDDLRKSSLAHPGPRVHTDLDGGMYSATGLCDYAKRPCLPAPATICEDLTMRFFRAIATLALAVGFAAAPGAAQEVVTEKALSLDMAHAIAQGAVEKCRADGY